MPADALQGDGRRAADAAEDLIEPRTVATPDIFSKSGYSLLLLGKSSFFFQINYKTRV